jgi:hypothetical protein
MQNKSDKKSSYFRKKGKNVGSLSYFRKKGEKKDMVNKNTIIHVSYFGPTLHTIRKCQKIAWQNTFKILLLNDSNMIREH